jgi:hypothetical protein
MRPQGFGQSGASLEDLGWNDMGFEPPQPAVTPVRDDEHDAFGEEIDESPRVHPTGLTPVHSPVHTQQAEIVDRLSDPDEEEFDETAEPAEPAEPAELAIEEPEVDEVIVAPVVVPVVAPAPRRTPKSRAAPGSKAKAAFTLRLDPSRHFKLRLACAVNGRSAQQLVTDALDALLTEMPELDAMAAKANQKG